MKKQLLIFLLISSWAFGQVTILPGKNGGTGIANTGKTITLGGSVITTGTATPTLAFPSTNRTFTFQDASSTLAMYSNNLSVFAATTSAQLAGVISDETGSGALVFGTSPTFVTPALGTPASGDISNCTGNVFTIAFESGLLSPADATTYYFSDMRLTPNTTATNFSFNLGYAYKIIGIRLSVGNNTVSGSNEASTLQVRNITQATSTSVGTFLTNGSTSQIVGTSFTGLNISVAATDEIALQVDAATWATNPTTILFFATLICQKQ